MGRDRPFADHAAARRNRDEPLTIWKHNFLGVMSSFPLDYGRINPRNAELDAFNHQITAGWMAISDGDHGLLLADSADVRTSFAFAPMRLREHDGRQVVSIDPFGTYHGDQLAYDHLGGTGLGTALTIAGASHLRPNGPSYNGRRERFSLLIAPYAGDAPPDRLRADAEAFFHPPAVVVPPPGLPPPGSHPTRGARPATDPGCAPRHRPGVRAPPPTRGARTYPGLWG